MTGVQTCALPISKTVYTARTASGQEGRKHTPKPRREEHSSHTEDHSHPEHGESMHAEHGAHEIGRASCRERV